MQSSYLALVVLLSGWAPTPTRCQPSSSRKAVPGQKGVGGATMGHMCAPLYLQASPVPLFLPWPPVMWDKGWVASSKAQAYNPTGGEKVWGSPRHLTSHGALPWVPGRPP